MRDCPNCRHQGNDNGCPRCFNPPEWERWRKDVAGIRRDLLRVTPQSKERLFEKARRHGDFSLKLYEGTATDLPSVTDPIDGEINRLMASLYGRAGSGEWLDDVTEELVRKAREAAQAFSDRQMARFQRRMKSARFGLYGTGPEGHYSPEEAETKLRHAAYIAELILRDGTLEESRMEVRR